MTEIQNRRRKGRKASAAAANKFADIAEPKAFLFSLTGWSMKKERAPLREPFPKKEKI